MAPPLNIPLPLADPSKPLPKLTSPLGLTYIFTVVLILYLLYNIISIIYIHFFHPLRHIPGPKLWITIPIIPKLYSIFGTMDAHIVHYHSIYGGVLRIGPDELTFATSQAWNDIYGYKQIPQLQKPNRLEKGKTHSIINADDKNHTRFRKALSHGFSERSLREQEGLVMSYVNLLVEKLQNVAKEGEKTNLVRWYNYTTFDIIGDLSFGESFNCLNSSTYHFWVLNIISLIDFVPILRGRFDYPLTLNLLALVLFASKTRFSRDNQEALVRDRLTRRINNESQKGRNDFIDSMLRHQGDKDEISFDEMAMTASTLVLAGSETTASLMSGVTFYLCKNPHIYDRVRREIREKFKDEDEITFASVMECEYMMAVLEEGLRMYPPAPSMFNRETFEDMVIDGVKVPKKTSVAVHQLSAYRSAENWRRPYEFLPERWLKEGKEGEFRDDNRAVLQPFHVGPRNCIGRNLALAEMRVILAKMLWHFDFELCPESEQWAYDQQIKVLWVKPELMCRIKIRPGLGKSG